MCTAYYDTTPAGKNITCTLNEDWDLKTRRGIAAILNKASAGFKTDKMTSEYFAAEMAINVFIYENGGEKYGGKTVNHLTGTNNLGSAYKTLYAEYLAAAKAEYERDVDLSFSVSSDQLSFTKSGSNYVSNSITVTSNVGYDATTNIGTIEKSGNSIKVVVPVSSVQMGSTVNVNVTIKSGTILYSVARNYDCGSSYQTLTPAKTETVTDSKTQSVSGSITREKTSVKVLKIDSAKNKIKDVEFMLQTEAQYKAKTDGTKKVTNGKDVLTFDGLVSGTYYLSETKPADGYNDYTQVVKLTIDEDGQVYVSSKKMDNNTITITNTKTKTEISKINSVDSKELPGATLQILDKDKKEMSCTILDEDGKEKKLDKCTWVSGEEPVIIVGLNRGKYYLEETIAPEGYELNENMVEFEVKSNGTTNKVQMKNDIIVEVPNTLSSKSAMLLSIAMFDIAFGIGILLYVKRNKIEE